MAGILISLDLVDVSIFLQSEHFAAPRFIQYPLLDSGKKKPSAS
jgi:hypothetical protein